MSKFIYTELEPFLKSYLRYRDNNALLTSFEDNDNRINGFIVKHTEHIHAFTRSVTHRWDKKVFESLGFSKEQQENFHKLIYTQEGRKELFSQ